MTTRFTKFIAPFLVLAISIFGVGCDSSSSSNSKKSEKNGGMNGGANNSRPSAVVSANRLTVPRGDNFQTIVRITAADSSDPDGDPLTFSWVVPSGRFENSTNANDEIIDVSFPGAAPYTVSVTVDDGQGGSDSASVTIGLQ